MNNELYIGIMSGTSLDGVDVVLCTIDEKHCELINSLELPFDERLKAEIVNMIAKDQVELSKLGEIDHRLGVLFADAVLKLMEKSGRSAEEIIAIGSHGQTLWHQPSGKYPFSMQLGDPNSINVKTGIPVVADFRRKDMALGGQGAPFAPAFHQFLFGDLEKKTAIVNIGGMANITILGETLLGYDTGPGNVLMDWWILQKCGKRYDQNGEWAAGGKVYRELLEQMLSDPYFSLKTPKSTGREKFNGTWLKKRLEGFSLSEVEIQATLLELTARSITNEVKRYDRELLLLCGGGARNSFLVERLKVLLPGCEVAPTDEYGVSGDFVEAMAFAWMAYKRIHKETVGLRDVTGASENTILGALYE